MSSSSPASQFGPNEWLVEEMYDQFLADPSSVDAAWHDFFADFKPTQQAPQQQSQQAKPAAGQVAPAGQQASATPNGQVDSASAKQAEPEQPAPKQAQPAADATPAQAAPASPNPAPAKPATESKPAATGDGKATGKAQDEPERKPLRGPAAAIAKNMDASLNVPTATSVRAVPAKLMADNRIVINNHLKRTRGGKISFTHLIGYAMVRALREFPNMNRHYELIDGKPNAVTPEHVNLGLAIDMQGKDGSRNLVVAAIKNTEDMTFLQFWQAYEGIIHKARNNKLTADDFSGTTISLTNPGGIGTVHSVPRLSRVRRALLGSAPSNTRLNSRVRAKRSWLTRPSARPSR